MDSLKPAGKPHIWQEPEGPHGSFSSRPASLALGQHVVTRSVTLDAILEANLRAIMMDANQALFDGYFLATLERLGRTSVTVRSKDGNDVTFTREQVAALLDPRASEAMAEQTTGQGHMAGPDFMWKPAQGLDWQPSYTRDKHSTYDRAALYDALFAEVAIDRALRGSGPLVPSEEAAAQAAGQHHQAKRPLSGR